MRCDHGYVVALDAHLARLRRGCVALGFAPPSEISCRRLLAAALHKKKFKTARLRLSVSKTRGSVKSVVVVKKLKFSGNIRKGFSVILARERRKGAGSAAGVKSLDRRFYDRLFKEAKRRRCDEAVFCNGRGAIAEGTRTNIFIVAAGAVATPGLDSGCLPGITRGIVIRCLRKMKIPFKERRLAASDLAAADEIFLTNAIIGVVGGTRLNKQEVGCGRTGRITRKIAASYHKEVAKMRRLVYNRGIIENEKLRIKS
jgi:branched-chain amino acid aminotransferase